MNLPITEGRGEIPGKRSASKGIGVVYFLRLRSGGLYIGASTDLGRRFDAHASGRGGRATRLDPPVSVEKVETFPTFAQARSREAQLKRWTRAKKEALLAGAVDRLQALSKSRENLNG
jgi:putative endonuclease